MPQHWVGRFHRPWRALVASLALVLAVGYVQAEIGQHHIRTVGDTPAGAARLALAEQLRVAEETIHVPFGGDDEWQTGTLTVPANDDADHGHAADEHAHHHEPRTFLYVAQQESTGWAAAVEGTPDFERMARQAHDALLGTSSAELLATTEPNSSGDGSAKLSLPWATGKTWRLTGGPHNFNGGKSRPWSSLDFAGPEPGMSVKVRAARGGVVVRPCKNLVQVRHGDGWATSYYHLKNIAVKAGQTVARGQFLGYTSNAAGCGGSSTGKHVHFSLLKSGSYVNIRGHTIGGWTVKDGSKPYEGCMVKNGVKRCAPNGKIYNDGAIGTSATLEPSTAALLAY